MSVSTSQSTTAAARLPISLHGRLRHAAAGEAQPRLRPWLRPYQAEQDTRQTHPLPQLVQH